MEDAMCEDTGKQLERQPASPKKKMPKMSTDIVRRSPRIEVANNGAESSSTESQVDMIRTGRRPGQKTRKTNGIEKNSRATANRTDQNQWRVGRSV